MSFGFRVSKVKKALKDFLLGATVYDTILDLREKRLLTEYMLMTVVLGDMFGFTVSSYYRLKILPFWVPRVQAWRDFMLKERDITDRLK